MKVDASLTKDLTQAAADARAIEASGYDGVWVGETKHDPFLLSLRAADATSRITVGTSIAQQMLQASTPGGGAGLPELVGPAEAAAALGVSESDVMASLQSGDLKGTKIGTQWRITKQALRDFLGASS